MANSPDPKIDYGATPDEEYTNIRKTTTAAILALWVLGVRLLRFRASFDWQQLTVPEAPFKDFTDFLSRGTGVHPSTAYRAMDAAALPYWCSEKLGIERASLLKKITDLTTVDETAEQAMALQLPLAGGGTKPVTEMTVQQMQTAYSLMREGVAQAGRSDAGAVSTPTAALQQTAAAATAAWLSPSQIRAHRKSQGLVLDLNDVPETQAAEVFSALARALRS